MERGFEGRTQINGTLIDAVSIGLFSQTHNLKDFYLHSLRIIPTTDWYPGLHFLQKIACWCSYPNVSKTSTPHEQQQHTSPGAVNPKALFQTILTSLHSRYNDKNTIHLIKQSTSRRYKVHLIHQYSATCLARKGWDFAQELDSVVFEVQHEEHLQGSNEPIIQEIITSPKHEQAIPFFTRR